MFAPSFPIAPVTVGSACIVSSISLFKAAARNKKKAMNVSASLIIQRVPSIQQAALGTQHFPAFSMEINL